MSKYIQSYPSRLMRFDEPFAYLTLTDFGGGRGLMQIHSDYGAYSFFWGAMGERSLTAFLAGASPSYIHDKLSSSLNYQSMKQEARRRLDKFMIECWPNIHEKLKADALEKQSGAQP